MFNWDDFINGKVGVSFEEKAEVGLFLKMVEERGLKLIATHDAYINSIFCYGSHYIFHDPIDMECYTSYNKDEFKYTVTYKEAFDFKYPSKIQLMEFLGV